MLPDFTKPDPLVTFKLNDVAFVYGANGSSATSRRSATTTFRCRRSGTSRIEIWRPYMVQPNTDWWVPLYPGGQHAAAHRPALRRLPFGELQRADESGHRVERRLRALPRPRQRARARGQSRANIVNPARLDYVRANDTCIQCHSQGQPLTNPIDGQYYDWPVGFHQGGSLKDFWKLEEHKLGETTFTHFADGTAHKNRMQGNDFVQSLMYTHGRDLLQLPRCARHGQQRGPDQAGQRSSA